MLGYAMYAFVINPYLLGYNVYQAFGWANVFLGVVGSNKLGCGTMSDRQLATSSIWA